MHSCVPHGPVICPLLFLLFVNYHNSALESLMLLFSDDVKVVTLQTQYMHLHCSLIAEWDWAHK